jgi:hypothetical protein
MSAEAAQSCQNIAGEYRTIKVSGGGDLNQSVSDVLVVGGSVSDAIAMQ